MLLEQYLSQSLLGSPGERGGPGGGEGGGGDGGGDGGEGALKRTRAVQRSGLQ